MAIAGMGLDTLEQYLIAERPISHWTEARIKGHFVVCFLAFLLERTLEFRLKQTEEAASAEQIRQALNSLNFAQIEMAGEGYLVKTKVPPLSNNILRAMGIAPPKNITPVSDITL